MLLRQNLQVVDSRVAQVLMVSWDRDVNGFELRLVFFYIQFKKKAIVTCITMAVVTGCVFVSWLRWF